MGNKDPVTGEGDETGALGLGADNQHSVPVVFATTSTSSLPEGGQQGQEMGREELELAAVMKEEEQLVETVGTLKKTLGLGTTLIGTKLEEIRKLTLKADELKSGGKVTTQVKKPKSLEVEGVFGMRNGVDAVAIFPEEVWKMILGNLSDPEDLWNLCNTCQLFNTILFPWKTGWMLGQALPYLYQHLPGSKLLESRLICRSWKGAVDHFLEDNPSLRPHDLERYNPRRLDFVNPMKEKRIGGLAYQFPFFYNNYPVGIFDLPDLEKWKRLRIIGRVLVTLKLGTIKPDELDARGGDDDDTDDDSEDDGEGVPMEETAKPGPLQLWEKFYHFLNSFGKDVWYLNMQYGHDPNETDAGAKEWEQKLLPFMTADVFRIFPQLRKLSIVQKEAPFQEAIDPQSLPPAPNLETFESTCYGVGIGTAILTRYHNQLGCLNLTVKTWREVNHVDWPNLKELHLNSFYNDEDFLNLWEGLRLPQLAKLGLNIERSATTGVEFQSCLRVVRELSAIAPLNTLRIEGLRGFHKMPIEGSCYDLSNVKTLEFDLCTGGARAAVYDFLLHAFPLLENLNVFIRELSYFSYDHCPGTDFELLSWQICEKYRKPLPLGKGHEIVEVNKFMYERAMYKSNIWELMPLLKVFSFQWDVYTRHEYEAYKEKQKDANC